MRSSERCRGHASHLRNYSHFQHLREGFCVRSCCDPIDIVVQAEEKIVAMANRGKTHGCMNRLLELCLKWLNYVKDLFVIFIRLFCLRLLIYRKET